MDDLLSVNEMASLLNLIKGRPHIVVPGVKPLVSEQLALVDSHDACEAVDFSTDTFVDNHIAKFILCALDADTD